MSAERDAFGESVVTSHAESLQTGELLCAIGNAGHRALSFKDGFDLFLFEQAVAAVRVTAQETYEGLKGVNKPTDEDWTALAQGRELTRRERTSLAHARRLRAKGAREIGELLSAHPDNYLVPRSAITQARIRKGLLTSALTLSVSNGETRKWVWGSPNVPIDDVRAALVRIVGSSLVAE